MPHNKSHYKVTDFFNFIGDGVADDTLELQGLLDKVAKFQAGKTVRIDGGKNIFSHNFAKIDLCGKSILVNSPIKIKSVHGIIITNGSIIAGDQFKEEQFLLTITNINTIKLENLILECNKKSNGIFFNQFFRVRIEDCTIMHQTHYGIYSNETGQNHELEVVKCNIVEYNWGDGINEISKGKLPPFNISQNRTSTGIFLGQADNVVTDCNINLCKIGILVGMRANRIRGNHITSGGVKDNALFDGIVLNKHIKSSCLIVNNYIDNCRIKIYVDKKQVNGRNYVTITDNLFYRGFNHPINEEFNHIVIRPLTAAAILQNIIVCNNQFYTQDEHLDDQISRHITPIRVDTSPLTKQADITPGLDYDKIAGAIVKNNVFTNVESYYEQPQATALSAVIEMSTIEKDEFSIDLDKYIPWGNINTYQVTMTPLNSEDANVCYFVKSTKNNKLILSTSKKIKARFDVMIDINRPYSADKNIIV